MCAYMCIHVRVHTGKHMCTFSNMYLIIMYDYVHVCVSMCIMYNYARAFECACVCMHLHVCASMYNFLHACTYNHACTIVHTCVMCMHVHSM